MRFTQSVQQEKEVKLDLKDKKILYWLSENARMPYTKIAKKVGLSKDAVKYRIKNLEKKGVIQGYLSVIDVEKLGYNAYHIFMQFNRINKEIKNKLIEIFKSYPFTRVIIECSGKYDFEIGIVAKNIEELDELITKMIDDVSEYLKEHQILIISKKYVGRTFPKSFIVLKDEFELQKYNSEFKIDKIDLEILNALAKDATIPLYEMEKPTKLSVDAINYRIKKMIKEKLILSFVPIINYSVLGYTTYVVLMDIHNLSKEKEKSLEHFLKGNENILWSVKTIGKYNLLVYVCVKKSDELHQTLMKLREIFSSDIKDYETLIAYEEYKYTYFPEICKVQT